MSRRSLLRGSSALGAAGAFGIIMPAAAWTWSPTSSVIGTGSGLDPRQVWDDEADTLVAALFARGEVDRVN
ncbi:twin-arginine translocation signal domain-containing protein, partial [Nocardioides sp. GCM10030258]